MIVSAATTLFSLFYVCFNFFTCVGCLFVRSNVDHTTVLTKQPVLHCNALQCTAMHNTSLSHSSISSHIIVTQNTKKVGRLFDMKWKLSERKFNSSGNDRRAIWLYSVTKKKKEERDRHTEAIRKRNDN